MSTRDFGFHRILKKHPSSESTYDIGMTFIPWLFHALGKYLSVDVMEPLRTELYGCMRRSQWRDLHSLSVELTP